MRTLWTLCRGQSTIVQLDILARANRLYADRMHDGRGYFYGGAITDDEYAALTAGLRLNVVGEDGKVTQVVQ
jgi:hypothetical protein